jgi:transcription initiation factor TFIID subunit 5|eukprot:Stramenopile-MAST_4_protein_1021
MMMADFLSERGFTEAAEKIDPRVREEVAEEDDDVQRSTKRDVPTSIQKASVQDVLQSYADLDEWVRSSLDLYKHELFGILFPVFSHFFMTLAKFERFDEAHKLLEKYGDSFLADNADDLYSLKMINSKEQVEKDGGSFTRKTVVHMSQFAFNLLISYLQDSNLFLVIAAINQKINVQMTSSSNFSTSQSASHGERRDGMSRCNQKEITWGVIKKRERPTLPEEEAELARVQAKINEAGQMDKKKKQKAQDNKDLAQLKKDIEAAKQAPPWIGEVNKKSLPDYYNNFQRNHGDWKSDIIEKLIVRATPTMKKAEENDLKHLESLGYAADGRSKPRNMSAETPGNKQAKLPSIACFTMLNTGGQLCCGDLSADGAVVAGGFSDSVGRLWRLDKEASIGKEYGSGHTKLPGDQLKSAVSRGHAEEAYTRLVGHSMSVTGCSISCDNQWLLTSSQDSSVRLWHVGTGMSTAKYTMATESLCPIWGVSFAPYGHFFASCSHDNMAYAWTVERSVPIRHFFGHASDVSTVRYHPNSIFVGTGSMDNSVRLWDMRDGNVCRVFKKHPGPVHSLAFSPNGQFLASAGEDNKITIWDLQKGAKFGSLEWSCPEENAVWSLDYSVDGTILAAAGSDGVVRLWDAALAQKQTKRRIEDYPSLLKSYQTKQTQLISTRFSPRNILMTTGAFMPA